MRSAEPRNWSSAVRLWTAVLSLLAGLSSPAREAPAVGPRVITDFDRVKATTSIAGALTAADTRADGNTFLLVTARGGEARQRQLLFALPPDVRPDPAGGFAFRARAVGGAVDTRLVALDASDRVILQRRLKMKPSQQFQELNLPWTAWRWGDDTGGGPGEIRKIGLRFESDAGELQLDDVALAPAGRDAEKWFTRVAFFGRHVRTAGADGLLVATDAVEGADELTEADLTRILGRMRAARKLVRRLFADAVRPIEGPTPAALLIFREQNNYVSFFESAGGEWEVKIAPPAGAGFTVQNISGTTFDPGWGADRPVFLHESVHAVLANDVRLLTGDARHAWLHEGLASYVQLCVYPGSIDRRQLAENFRKPIAADGSGFFKPLGPLVARRPPARQYAQLGTLVAYFINEKPQWLPVIARALAEGATAEQAVRKCGTTLPELQDAWMKWGAEKVGDAGDAGAMLPVPEEFEAADAGAAPPGAVEVPAASPP